MQTDLRIDKATISFLRAFDAVASYLRSLKQLQMDAESRGDLRVDMPVERMWNASHETILLAASAVVVPVFARVCAEALLRRLRVWQTLARQAREMKEPELEVREAIVEFHVREIWESPDESALAAWETMRARMIGAQELPFMDEAV